MATASPATYALLGLLASRSWSGYELTQQVQRSLRFAWPTSEGHLYREQKRLVTLGWAQVDEEQVGERTRNRYAITEAGRAALRAWLATEPQEPQLHIEGILRAFYGDRGEVSDLVGSMRATASAARSMCSEVAGFAAEYLEEGGPVELLERGNTSERGAAPPEFHGRPVFPERLHVVAVAMDAITQLLESVGAFFEGEAEVVQTWASTTDPAQIAATRSRLERIRERG